MGTVRIGDIFQIATPKGLAYAQYTHQTDKAGAVIRVLPGLYQTTPAAFDELAAGPTQFITLFPLKAAVARKIVRVVAHQPIPEHEKPFPLFRSGSADLKTGRVETWWFWDGEKSWPVGQITEEQRKMPIRVIVNDTRLIELILSDWSPEKEPHGFGLIPKSPGQELAAEMGGRPGQSMKHYLYFPLKENARRAAEELENEGFRIEVRLGADQENWLVLARHTIEGPFEELRDRFERLATKLGGEYDGWEAEVDAAAANKARSPNLH